MLNKSTPQFLFFITLTFITCTKSFNCQGVGINETGASPDASAMLDIASTTAGLLVPRMTTAQKNLIASPETSLLVFDTSIGEYYYFDGAKWIPILSSNTGWQLAGNSGTTPGTDFIGTTDAQSLIFKTSGTEQMRISAGGLVGMGTTNPLQTLHVADDIIVGGGQNGDYDGNTEHVKFWSRSKVWNVGVVNDAFSTNSDFFISQIDGTNDGTFTINPNGNIGINQLAATHRLEVLNTTTTTDIGAVYGNISNTQTAYGVLGYNTNDIDGVVKQIGVYGNSGTGEIGMAARYASTIFGYIGSADYGIYGRHDNSTKWAGYFQGDVHVNGTLSKSAGTFKIDHPLDPENKYLIHSFVESPDMMNIYNGNVITDSSGYASVILPEYFEAANKSFRYQLTVIGVFSNAIIKEKITGNTFVIQTDQSNVEVSWQVTGVRNDAYAQQNRIEAEEVKEDNDKGKYLNPEAYGKPESEGLHFHIINDEENKK